MPLPLLLLPPPLSYWSQAATGGQCSAIAGSSGSAENREEDFREVASRAVAQGPQETVDEHYHRQEGGVSIQDGTEDVSEERTRSSDFDSVQARGTPPRPRSSSAACYLGGRNGTRTHKEKMMNHERWVQEKRQTLLTRVSNGDQAL